MNMELVNLIKVIKIALIVLIVSEVFDKRKIKRRRWWVREVNKTRDVDGFFITSYKQLKAKDEEHFFKAVRMAPKTFNFLLLVLKERLSKRSLRKPIEPETRLAITLM